MTHNSNKRTLRHGARSPDLTLTRGAGAGGGKSRSSWPVVAAVIALAAGSLFDGMAQAQPVLPPSRAPTPTSPTSPASPASPRTSNTPAAAPDPAFAPGEKTRSGELPRGGAGPLIDLRPRWIVGETHRFAMRLSNQSQDVPTAQVANPPKSQMEQQIGLAIKVVEKREGGGFALDVVYESVKVTITDGNAAPTSTSAPTSKDVDGRGMPPGNTPAATNKGGTPTDKNDGDDDDDTALSGLTIRVLIDKDGFITSTSLGVLGATGLDLKGLGGGPGGNTPDETDLVKGISEALSGLLSAQGMGMASGTSSYVGGVAAGLLGPVVTSRSSTGEARVGDSWVHDDLIHGPAGEMKLVTQHTLRSHRDEMATIDQRGRFDLQPKTAGAGNLPTIRESAIDGRTLWNTRDGMLESMSYSQRLVLEYVAAGAKNNTLEVQVTRKR